MDLEFRRVDYSDRQARYGSSSSINSTGHKGSPNSCQIGALSPSGSIKSVNLEQKSAEKSAADDPPGPEGKNTKKETKGNTRCYVVCHKFDRIYA